MEAKKPFCKNHETIIATHFCFGDKAAVCKGCAEGACFYKGHTLVNLEEFHRKRIEELDSLEASLAILGDNKFLTNFKNSEIKRVNDAFDAKIAQIEETRARTLEGVLQRLDEYLGSQNLSVFEKSRDLQEQIDEVKQLGMGKLAEMVVEIDKIRKKLKGAESLSLCLSLKNSFFDSSKLLDTKNISLTHSKPKIAETGSQIRVTDDDIKYLENRASNERKICELESTIESLRRVNQQRQKPKETNYSTSSGVRPPWERMGWDKEEWIDRYESMNDNDPKDWDDPDVWRRQP
mmetsp:Transcript_46734/g.53906  ORF Transcript_46734/g.53906 Transcript_46734/m.53906 type:complete len:292 (+) Transcript_46734:54-929(+)